MKFTKPKVAPAEKSTSLSQKGKFKSKKGATNGISQKPSKNALNLIKNGSISGEVCTVVKGNVKEKISQSNGKGKNKNVKKSESGPKLSEQVKLGLKLDAMLDKSQKSSGSSSETSTPNKRKMNSKKRRALKLKIAASTASSQPPVASFSTPNNKQASKVKAGNLPNKNKPHTTNPPLLEKQTKGGKRKQPVEDSKPDPPNSNIGGKKKKKPANQRKEVESNIESNDKTAPQDSDFTLNPSDVLGAAKAALQLLSKHTAKKKQLHEQLEPIFLSFVFYQPHPHQKVIRFKLAHSLVTDTSEVCLFCTDANKKDPEESKSMWTTILRKENCSRITQVIPLRSLMKDYTQFEDKRKLSDRFDHFMVDARVSHRVHSLLGVKHFHSKRKSPVPVDLTKHIKERIDRALTKTVALYKVGGETFSIQVAHSGMTEKQLQENILEVWQQYPHMFGVYWENVRRLSLFTPHTSELPVFVSIKPPTEVRTCNSMVWKKSGGKPVQGELSTSINKKVAVYPSGKIVVKEIKNENGDAATKKGKKAAIKKEQVKVEEESSDDDDLGGRGEMMDSDLDDAVLSGMNLSLEQEDTPLDKKGKKKSKMQKKKGTEADGGESSDDENGVDRAEQLYLEELATATALNKKSKATMKGGSGKVEGTSALATVDFDSEDDSEDSDYEVDSDDVGIPSSDGEMMDSSVDEDDGVGEEEEEVEEVKPTVVGRKMQQQQQQGKKNMGNLKQSGQNQQSGKGKKIGNNKPGAQKKKGSGPQNSNNTSPSPSKPATTKKKNSNSFQGIKVDQTKKRQVKKRPNRKNTAK